MTQVKRVGVAGAKLSKRQVIDRLMQMIKTFPEAVENVPAKLKTRAYWEKTFSPRNPFAGRVLEVLQELPAFTNQAPRANTRKAWLKVFANYMKLEQIAPTLGYIAESANFVPVKRPVIRYWREAFGKDEVMQRIRPVESDAYLHNPHRGTATYQRFQGDELCPTLAWGDKFGPTEFPPVGKEGKPRGNQKYIPRTTLTYCRWPWATLEPEKGGFNWAPIDGTLRMARVRGQTAQLRFQPYTTPVNTTKHPPKSRRFPAEAAVDVPDWYWDTGAAWIAQGPFSRNEIDSNDPMYVRHFGEFIRAFAARYDGHPDLESIDIAYAGYWGENGGNSTLETAAKLAEIYLESFQKTQLMGMLPTPGFAHAFRKAAGEGRHIGWRADFFGDFHLANVLDVPADKGFNHMLDCYVQSEFACGAQDAWKYAPITMEPETVPHWMMHGFDLDRIIYEGLRFHTTVFMPKSNFYPERFMAKLIEFDKKIGYRYVVRHMMLPLEAKAGVAFRADVFLDNVGCAPIYRPYRLALRFTQGKTVRVVPFAQDIRQWLPGHNFVREELPFPQGFERGEVKVALGIIDDSGTPCVSFAIEGKIDEGWHPLTSMDVLN